MNKTLEFHEIAAVFPLMEGSAFDALKGDIGTNGQREPIRLYQGKILDGRNRYRACDELGVTPRVADWSGPDPVAFVVSLNLHRRHLNESQRAMVAARIAGLSQGQTRGGVGADAPIGASAPIPTQPEAAALMTVGRRNVQRARKVQTDGVPGLAKAVDDGRVAVAAAVEVATLPAAEQAAVVQAGPKAVKAKAAEVRAGRSRVNGVEVPDPPDVAAARAAGKIAPGVVVEVTEPGPAAAAPEPEPADAEQTDDQWLDTLPVRPKLGPGLRRKFDADALDYRRLDPHRKTFSYHANRVLKGRGEYAYRVSRLLKTDHPKHWLLCPATEHGGCGGTGEVALIGQCAKCRGKGYWIK